MEKVPRFRGQTERTFTMVTKRKALLASLATTGLVLAACSGDGGNSDNPAASEGLDSRGPITFAMGNNDIAIMQDIAERWNADHPDEQVTVHELAGEADAQRESLIQSLQAGSGDYDVMALDLPWTAEFAAAGYLAPIEGDLHVDTEQLLQPSVDSATYNDKLYAVPQNTNGQLLYVNNDVIPEMPTNWEELVASCDEVPEGEGCLTLQLSQYEGLTINTLDFIYAWGGEVVNSDNEVVVDSDEAREGLQALVDAYNDGVITSASTGATEEETMQAFSNEESAMAVNWPYMYEASNGTDVEGKFDVSPIVGPDGVGVSTLGGYNNAINAYSENKATARDFVEYVIHEDSQKLMAEQSFPPVLSSIYDDESLIEEYPFLPALKESLENAQPRPVSPYYAAMSKAIQDNAYAAINGTKSVDQAITDMQSALEQADR